MGNKSSVIMRAYWDTTRNTSLTRYYPSDYYPTAEPFQLSSIPEDEFAANQTVMDGVATEVTPYDRHAGGRGFTRDYLSIPIALVFFLVLMTALLLLSIWEQTWAPSGTGVVAPPPSTESRNTEPSTHNVEQASNSPGESATATLGKDAEKGAGNKEAGEMAPGTSPVCWATRKPSASEGTVELHIDSLNEQVGIVKVAKKWKDHTAPVTETKTSQN